VNPRDEQHQLAIHEAAHAVMRRLYGINVRHVTIAPDDPQCEFLWNQWTAPFELACGAMAGLVAVAHFAGEPLPKPRDFGARDRANINEALALDAQQERSNKRTPRSDSCRLDSWMSITQGDVTEHWSAIQRVAMNLLKHRTLHEHEVDEIIARETLSWRGHHEWTSVNRPNPFTFKRSRSQDQSASHEPATTGATPIPPRPGGCRV